MGPADGRQLPINVLLAGRQLFHQLLQLFGCQLLVNALSAGRQLFHLPALGGQLLLQLFDESGSFGFGGRLAPLPPGETQINDIDLTPSSADKVRVFFGVVDPVGQLVTDLDLAGQFGSGSGSCYFCH